MSSRPQIAIVTGAAGALGSAIARKLVEKHWQVATIDADREALDAFAAGLGSSSKIHAVYADATDEGQVAAYIDALSKEGEIVGLVNGVGGEGDAVTIPEHSVESFERTMRLNVTSVLIHMKYVIPKMAERGSGSIVNIGSVSSVLGNPRDVAYTAAKHAVIGLTRAAASEWGRQGIRTNVVCPAPIESPLMEAFESAQPADAGVVRNWYITQTPSGRYGQPEEVADAVAFLLSDDSAYMNGSVIMLDGGLTASGRPA